MRFSALPIIIAGAGLLQVNASPLRVVYISPESLANNESLVQLLPSTPTKLHQMGHAENGTRKGCAGNRFRGQKSKSLSFSITVSNTLRQALGMPLIEAEFLSLPPVSHLKGDEEGRAHHHHHHHAEQEMTGDGARRKHHSHHHDHHEQAEDEMINMQEDGVRRKHHHNHHHEETQSMQGGPVHHKHHFHGHFHGKGSFMQRILFALMSLGPWEGRAVAFVLGCGLGVLLRMFWVFTVVAYRTVRGNSQEQEESYDYIPVLNQLDAEEIFVAPPVYIVDEKAPLKEELKAADADAQETN